MNCQNIDSKLLVQLIRLKKSVRKPIDRTQSFSNTRKSPNYKQQVTNIIDIDRQVDISFPSLNYAPQIDMEIIGMTLNVENYKIEKIIQESENEYFRRVTIQLEQMNDIGKLLSLPIVFFNTNNIKLKRTKTVVDQTSFVLKTPINDRQTLLAENRVRLYISLLIGNTVAVTLINLSTANEQIFLVQCNTNIEFEKVYKQYQLKPQLQDKHMSLIQIYECDTIMMRYSDDKKIMKYDDIENIIQSARMNVFTYQLTDDNCVEIEFISADGKIFYIAYRVCISFMSAFKEWMSTVEKIIAKFRVIVTPIISNLDDRANSESSNNTIAQNIQPVSMEKQNTTTITLRSEWAMVAAHPIFKMEFTNYIHDELGGEIEINGNTVTYTGNFPVLPRCPTNEAVLANKTNNYMQKLKYQTFNDLKPYHVNILRAHSNIVAFDRVQRNDYAVAAKPTDMFELKNKLFPKRNQSNGTQPLIHRQSIDKSPLTSLSKNETMNKSYSLSSLSSINTTTSIYPIATPEQMSMFSINTFENRLQQYLNETFNVKITIERNTNVDKSRVIIRITGETNDVDSAMNDLVNLFLSLRTRKFDDKTHGAWTKIEEATQVIQHHFTLLNLICTCQQISLTNVIVNYFDITNPQFGVDEQQIEDLINNQFSSATINYNQQTTSSQFMKEWTSLEETIRKRNDYKKNICLYNETNTIYIFGVTKLVKEFRQTFEQLKNKYVPQSCKIVLSPKQLKYLTNVAKNEFNKLEKQYKTNGCDLSLVRLRQHGDFLAPLEMHTKIKDSLNALVQINEITFEIGNSSAFEVLIEKEPERLISLVRSKCYLEKEIRAYPIDIPVPKAQIVDLEDLAKQSQNISVTNITSINVGNSTITIATGDLTTQRIDIIVVCLTSEIMRKSVIDKAGPQVQAEYNTLMSNAHQTITTSNGSLPCKRILFLPWQSSPATLKPSLSEFISTAITHAVKNQYKTIAFPSVGCGKLGFDPSIIAKYMIDETKRQLETINSKLDVSFILLPNQQNVYDEFVKYLNSNKTSPSNRTNNQMKISYAEKNIAITLISSNDHYLQKCKQEILDLAHSASHTTTLTNKDDMVDWSQNTINQYYEYCLKQHVKPTFDFNTLTIELNGPKDAVNDAEKYFYELTADIFKQARNHAVSRGVIWSVEVTPNSDIWQQYSFKLNGVIEDAYFKRFPHLDFVNDKQEKCRIVFGSKEEQHGSDVRRIRRKVIDSSLPDTWEASDQNCKRVTLQSLSKEYQDVLRQFNTTMNGHYTNIVKIERIQNERWYKQYAAHREEYKRRDGNLDEKLLFHGCLNASSNQIIQECFNRSFAGVNGVVYGCGVYFHSHASYSHQYAKTSGTNERTMFLARVLIGKTCPGNPQMKVPPSGYDTTTDGKHIFVVYHDAGAYADHLITYQ
ncbi:unnamed protein product [Adineta steineri]|uniref:Poly [ADP-ribose] polymerase n=3 Tax=Adineta steineri TaxID=433720 RepID=A0A815U1R7_9BILA|nr:unnamed protein product [Adineta steineri]